MTSFPRISPGSHGSPEAARVLHPLLRRAVGCVSLCLMAVLTGCTALAPPLYTPNTVHSPMLREAGEVQVAAMAANDGTDLEGAIAITDHVGIVGGYSFADVCRDEREFGECDPNTGSRQHAFAEGGVVLTHPTVVDGLSAELVAGYGVGEMQTYGVFDYEVFRANDFDRVETDYRRYFVQPGLFFDVGFAQIGASARVSQLRFDTFETTDPALRGDDRQTFVETALTLRAGPDPALFFLQVGQAHNVGPAPPYGFREDFAAVGVRLRLDQLFR